LVCFKHSENLSPVDEGDEPPAAKEIKKAPRRATTSSLVPWSGHFVVAIKFIVFSSLLPVDHLKVLVGRLQKMVRQFNPDYADVDQLWPVVADLQDAAIDRVYQDLKAPGKKPDDPRALVFHRWGEDTTTRMKTVPGMEWIDDDCPNSLYSVCRDGNLRR
jgi:hypothetical protein